jgi:hypothetical protein
MRRRIHACHTITVKHQVKRNSCPLLAASLEIQKEEEDLFNDAKIRRNPSSQEERKCTQDHPRTT